MGTRLRDPSASTRWYPSPHAGGYAQQDSAHQRSNGVAHASPSKLDRRTALGTVACSTKVQIIHWGPFVLTHLPQLVHFGSRIRNPFTQIPSTCLCPSLPMVIFRLQETCVLTHVLMCHHRRHGHVQQITVFPTGICFQCAPMSVTASVVSRRLPIRLLSAG